MGIARSQRDNALLDTLVHRVRVLSVDQIAAMWWPDTGQPHQFAQRCLRRLERAALIVRQTVLTEPPLRLSGPVVNWAPGHSTPNFAAVSYALQSRWQGCVPSPMPVVAATRKAIHQYGGHGLGGLRQRLQVNHDLHLAAVYLLKLRQDPALPGRWVGEDQLGKAGYGIKDPDAFLLGPLGQTECVVEFGGRYDERRVRSFHEHCARFGMRYELW